MKVDLPVLARTVHMFYTVTSCVVAALKEN